jgi:Spy/CpxP family protein refolding chaperone
MKIGRRAVLSGLLTSAIISAAAWPALATNRPPPKKPAPKRKPVRRPIKAPKPQKRTMHTTIGRNNRQTIQHGRSLLRNSARGRNTDLAHASRHIGMPKSQLKSRADADMRRIVRKQQAGQKLSAKEAGYVANGRRISSYYSQDIMALVVGRAEVHARGALRNGTTSRVKVKSEKALGTIYNSKTGKFTEGRTGVVVFAKDKAGTYVKTVYVDP